MENGFMIKADQPMQTFIHIQRNYDRLSRWYDLLEGWGERSVCLHALDLLNLQPHERLLEIGSGTGTNLARMAKEVRDCSLVGVDLSFAMNRQAWKKIDKQSLKIIHLVNGNAIWLPFPDGCFDAVLLCFALEIIPAKFIPEALNEIKRVLKPAGRLCVAAMSAEFMNSIMMRLYRWSIDKFPQVVDCRPIHLETILLAAGLKPLVNHSLSLWGLPVRVISAQK
jgi:ubiquinone/menaquinone biosynthesis C-methylase UbiE